MRKFYLLDTSILIHICRNSPVFQAIDHELQLTSQDFQPAISIISQGELLCFATQNGWGVVKRKSIGEILHNLVILPIDEESIPNHYADLMATGFREGLNIGQNDLWIAATSIVYDLILLTTDKDFSRCPPPLKYILFDQNSGSKLEEHT